jgi:hypothetical protein
MISPLELPRIPFPDNSRGGMLFHSSSGRYMFCMKSEQMSMMMTRYRQGDRGSIPGKGHVDQAISGVNEDC